MVDEFYIDLVAVIQWFVYYFYLKLPVYVCRNTSTQDIFGFDVFVCILLKTESTEMILVVVGDIVMIEVNRKWGEWDVIV